MHLFQMYPQVTVGGYFSMDSIDHGWKSRVQAAKPSVTTRILLVDDHLMFAEALSFMLEAEIAGTKTTVCQSTAAALEAMMAQVVDVILLDIELVAESGLGVLDMIGVVYPERKPRVLLCSAYERPVVIARAIEKGASGFASKSQSAAEIAQAIRQVLNGEIYLSPTIRDEVRPLLESGTGRSALLGLMSSRQLDILACLGEGLSNKQIAGFLNLSENTVKTHLKEIFDKLNVSSRTACVKKAVAEGLLTLT
ncbi:two component transcriptional regulator, LuxR family [Marinobacter zhejiangensis]|uniref:Two component transcriptional regulator, LuxR family n=1 Tax=Marinobacter zhejiangensis TaxID=488535 RepID=A0A1I4TPW0_9GAMM|nr:two component transcriptional regulator, LuxR family [Marinobacter zhejiangensis]